MPLGFLLTRVSPEKHPSHHSVLLHCLCWLLETLISPRSRNVTVLNGTDKPPPRELIAGRVSRGRRRVVMLRRKETSLLIQIAYCYLRLNDSPSKKTVRQYSLVRRGIPAERAVLNIPSVCVRLGTHVQPKEMTCIFWEVVLAQCRGWLNALKAAPCLRIRKRAVAPGSAHTMLRGWASLGDEGWEGPLYQSCGFDWLGGESTKRFHLKSALFQANCHGLCDTIPASNRHPAQTLYFSLLITQRAGIPCYW